MADPVKKRINAVLICGGTWHDIDFARLELLKLLAELPEIRTTVAIDFAKVLILDQGSICLMSILIAIHLGTREMEIVNVAHNPDGRITVQCARNLTMDGVGFFKRLGIKTVIMDRDPIFTEEFRHLLSKAGCEPHQIAPRCPWENGCAERFIRSLKESLLRKCDFDSESALRLALFEFQTYFNNERPHQGSRYRQSYRAWF